MKNSIKGALLSGVVFPGLGQVILKHYKSGIALMLIVSVNMLLIIVKAVQQIGSEGGTISMSTISNAATQASTASESLIFKLLLLLIIFCWIIGTVDAYRIGKKKDIEERSTNQVSNREGN